MKRYHVTATNKNDNTQVDFVVTSDGHKQAWVDARAACRIGGELTPFDGDEALQIEPGQYTVRTVFVMDKARKRKVVTLQNFLDAAEEHGIQLNKRLTELAEELLADEDDGSEEESEEAA